MLHRRKHLLQSIMVRVSSQVYLLFLHPFVYVTHFAHRNLGQRSETTHISSFDIFSRN